MAVYKEGFYAIQAIEKASKQIYLDACDYGAPISKGDALWNQVKQLFNWYGLKSTREVDEYSTGKTLTGYVSLIEEFTTGKTVFFKLTYVTATRMPGGGDGYVYVEKVVNRTKISELVDIENKELAQSA